MNEHSPKRLITAREAEAYIPPLDQFVGNYQLVAKLVGWLKRPGENDGNLLVEGDPGTGKTTTIIAYLREQLRNPFFYRERFEVEHNKARGIAEQSRDRLHEWPDRTGKDIYFKQIDGATDTEAHLRCKIEAILYGTTANHKLVLLDELGEAFFRGLDEALRPMLTETDIGVYATAQNFHSKRKRDTTQEEDQRLSALLRRFSHRERTEKPTEPDHLRFVSFLIGEWSLRVDHPSTLRLLVEKSNGIVGYSKRTLIKAIDAPDRRLTRTLVEDSDVDPLS